jgi:hypothetical protein
MSGPAKFSQAKYADPEYQKVHINLFSKSIIRPLQPVLPPGVGQADFDIAIVEWTKVVGKENVFGQDDLQEYIDPYELNEDSHQRKLPSAAVWYDRSVFVPSNLLLLIVLLALVALRSYSPFCEWLTHSRSLSGHFREAKTSGEVFFGVTRLC